MPAVQLARLKSEIGELAWKFSRPEDFRRGVNELFERYADRSYRAGQVVQMGRSAHAYHVPPLVMQQLEQELSRQIRENQEAALSAADALWKDVYLEPRLVASYLLGQVPVAPPEPVLSRLEAWCQVKEDRQALTGLLTAGCLRLRRDAPACWFRLLQSWLDTGHPASVRMVLQAILPAIHDREFENLPPIFQMVGPLVQSPPVSLQHELEEALEALARRCPTETAYFLRQTLSLSPGSPAVRLVRRILHAFPADVQEGLKPALKSI